MSSQSEQNVSRWMLFSAWPDRLWDSLLNRYRRIARLSDDSQSFTPLPFIRFFFVLFLIAVGLMAAYYVAWVQQCNDAMAFQQWGDPTCHTVYDSMFTTQAWQEQAGLFVDTHYLPLSTLTVKPGYTVANTAFSPRAGQCLQAVNMSAPTDYNRTLLGMNVSITVGPVYNVTLVIMQVFLHFDPAFIISMRGSYSPWPDNSFPPLRFGMNGKMTLFDDPRSDDPEYLIDYGNLTGDDVWAIYSNFFMDDRMYFAIALFLNNACGDYVKQKHLQQCLVCNNLSPGVALTLLASNAYLVGQVLLAMSVFCFRCTRSPKAGRPSVAVAHNGEDENMELYHHLEEGPHPFHPLPPRPLSQDTSFENM